MIRNLGGSIEEREVYPWTHLSYPNHYDKADNFRFAILADTHYSFANKYLKTSEVPWDYKVGKNVRACAEAMKKLKPEFVIIAGDCIEGNFQEGNFPVLWPGRPVPGKDSRNYVSADEERQLLNSEWNELDRETRKISCPVFYCTGNHELTPQDQYVGFPSPPGGKDLSVQVWEKRHGRRYYHFYHRHVLFLIADTEDPPGRHGAEISNEQVAYFQNALASYPDALWTILIQHRPPNSGAEKIKDLIVMNRFNNFTVFCGHTHRWRIDGGKGSFLEPDFTWSGEPDNEYFVWNDAGTVYEIDAAFKGRAAWVEMSNTRSTRPKVAPIACMSNGNYKPDDFPERNWPSK